MRSTSPGRLGLDLAEDVRVAADQLLGHLLGDLLERPLAALLEQQREEDDLEEDVAELVAKLLVVAELGRLGELIGLLDRVRDDRALVLLAVPGALTPQPAGDLVEALECVERQELAAGGWCGLGAGSASASAPPRPGPASGQA